MRSLFRRGLANVNIALGQLVRRPLRNLLLLQGVIWGTALAVFAPGSISGSRDAAFENWRTHHLDRIVVAPDMSGPDIGIFTEADVVAVRDAVGTARLRHVARLLVVQGDLVGSDGRRRPVALLGSGPDLQDARDFHATRGRYVTRGDVEDRRPVCIPEAELAAEIESAGDQPGRRLDVRLPSGRALELEVVGCMERRDPERLGQDALGMSEERSQDLKRLLQLVAGIVRLPGPWERDERSLHVPLSLLETEPRVRSWIYLRIRDFTELEACAESIASAMTTRGRSVRLFYDASVPFVVGDQLDIYLDLNNAISVCCSVMGVTVVVIMMLAGVLSRREEIGIRMVEGASRGDIAAQFLTEAGVTCLVGTLLGIPASFVLARVWLANELSQFAAYSLDPAATASSVLVICAAGLLAGIVPAWRASRLEVAAILRHE